MTWVIGVHVRKVDPPQFVAEVVEDLVDGLDWEGEQCDNCGSHSYELQHFRPSATPNIGDWRMRCIPTVYDDVLVAGCGTEYALRWYDEDEVTF